MAEKKIRFPGFVGPAYTSRVQRFDCQRLVNYYIEMDETGAGKGGEPAVLIGTPGLKFLQTIGSGPIRRVYTLSNQQLAYVVSGNEVYQISAGNSIPIRIDGNLTTSSGPVSIADNGYYAFIVDGSHGYKINIDTLAFTQETDPNFYPCTSITYQDGIFICSGVGTNEFFISDVTSSASPDITWPSNNLGAKTGNSDILICAFSNNRQLYLLGANTTEIWWNAGSGIMPFARQDGRFSQVGCVSAATVVTLGETFFWLGSNAQGGGIVYMLDNAMPTRVSNHAVEYAIQSYGDLTGATAYAYQQEGHYFYCLNIPNSNTTWVYDASVKQWAERQSTEAGVTGRHLGQTHCVLNDVHIVGDYRNGNIYEYDLGTYTDNGNMVLRIRQAPHISESLNRLFFKLMEVDFQFGVGLVNNGTNAANDVTPRVTIEISRDGGATFGNPMFATLGKIGAWTTRARWQRLGTGRDLVIRVTVSDPVKVQMLSAMVDIEAGFA